MKGSLLKNDKSILIATGIITCVVTLLVTFFICKVTLTSMPTVSVERETGNKIIIGKPKIIGTSKEYSLTFGKGFGDYKIQQYAHGRRLVIITDLEKAAKNTPSVGVNLFYHR